MIVLIYKIQAFGAMLLAQPVVTMGMTVRQQKQSEKNYEPANCDNREFSLG